MFISAHLSAFVAVVMGKFEDRKDERGITAIEYALMAAGIAIIIAVAIAILGDKIVELFEGVDTIDDYTPPAGG